MELSLRAEMSFEREGSEVILERTTAASCLVMLLSPLKVLSSYPAIYPAATAFWMSE